MLTNVENWLLFEKEIFKIFRKMFDLYICSVNLLFKSWTGRMQHVRLITSFIEEPVLKSKQYSLVLTEPSNRNVMFSYLVVNTDRECHQK